MCGVSFVVLLLFSLNLPKFELENLKGERVEIDSLKGDRFLLVDFWATWCKFCDDELDLLEELWEELGDSLLMVVGINIDSPRSFSKVRNMVKVRKWNFPILLDPTGRIKNMFGVVALPTIFLFDRDGNLLTRRLGYHPSHKEELKNLILESIGAQGREGDLKGR